jgi:hypothetical protein
MANESSDVYERIEQLRFDAYALPDGLAKLAMLEEVVRLADSINDIPLAFEMRINLFHPAYQADRPEVSIAAFSWCLAQHDRQPRDDFYQYLIDNYAGVIADLGNFPNVSRTQILDLLDDMERRHKTFGSTLHVVWSLRRDIFLDLGEHESAKKAHLVYVRKKPDDFSIPPLADLSNRADYFAIIGQYAKSVRAVEEYLSRGTTERDLIAETSLMMLTPLTRLRKFDRAAECFAHVEAKSRRYTSTQLRESVRILFYLSMTDQFAKAKAIFERTLPHTIDNFDGLGRLHFFRTAWLMTLRMKRHGIGTLKLRLTGPGPAATEDGQYPIDAVGKWLEGEAKAIAKRFDARNGNAWWSDYVAGAIADSESPGP